MVLQGINKLKRREGEGGDLVVMGTIKKTTKTGSIVS